MEGRSRFDTLWSRLWSFVVVHTQKRSAQKPATSSKAAPKSHNPLPIVGQPRRSGMARPTWATDTAGPRPDWLKVRLGDTPAVTSLRKLVHQSGLHTVCESAACPNLGECWDKGALTLMILGNICTRSCGFCDVQTGRPGEVDRDEPRRVAKALSTLGLRYAVITSVDRDDLPDGGASVWAETILAIRNEVADLEIEVLVPDFKGDRTSVLTVAKAKPNIYAHNIETTEAMHRVVRPQAKYARSLETLAWAQSAGLVTKSGIMLGLGEDLDDVVQTLKDLRKANVAIVNLGQYLRPGPRHLAVQRWVTPGEFAELAAEARAMGFEHVEAGPLVRSSYRADAQAHARAQAQAALRLSR